MPCSSFLVLLGPHQPIWSHQPLVSRSPGISSGLCSVSGAVARRIRHGTAPPAAERPTEIPVGGISNRRPTADPSPGTWLSPLTLTPSPRPAGSRPGRGSGRTSASATSPAPASQERPPADHAAPRQVGSPSTAPPQQARRASRCRPRDQARQPCPGAWWRTVRLDHDEGVVEAGVGEHRGVDAATDLAEPAVDRSGAGHKGEEDRNGDPTVAVGQVEGRGQEHQRQVPDAVQQARTKVRARRPSAVSKGAR